MDVTQGMEPRVFSAKIDPSGRVALPADVRTAMDVSTGDMVQIVVEGDSVEIKSSRQALRDAQAYFCSVIPSDVNVVDELLQERRDETARD